MKKWYIVVGVIVLLLFLFVGNDFYHTFQYRKNALLGLEAYEAGDCQTADVYFSKGTVHGLRTNTEIANFMRRGASIYSERRDCQAFLKSVELQEQGEFSEALLAYDALLSEDTLVSPIHEQIASLFEQAAPSEIANEAICLKLSEFQERGVIPNPQDNLPAFYAACGAIFYEEGRYGEAVTMYQRLLEIYPDHPLAEAADEKLAQALISEAEAVGAGTIGQPQSIRSTGEGPARVVIQNDSPQRISLVFTGLETLFEELEPCDTCENYTGSGPSACPEEGPIGTYELPAGTYKVVVKSISSGRVIPFTGEWTLRTGEVYYSCFYLVSRR
jgi:tetratricopeptide (TPR) repeat protein